MTRDDGLLAFVGALIVLVAYGAWYCTAPCSQVGWLPVKDAPARCVAPR